MASIVVMRLPAAAEIGVMHDRTAAPFTITVTALDAYGNVIPIFAQRLHTGQPLTVYGDGEQTRDFVNARDVARANLLAATRAERSGVYNVGCGESITINLLATLVQEASGIPTRIEYAPPRQGEVLHCKADIRRLRADLGFVPDPDIRRGLVEYFRWFAEDRSATPP